MSSKQRTSDFGVENERLRANAKAVLDQWAAEINENSLLRAENTHLRKSLRQAIADACREAGYDQAGEAAERFWKRIDAALS